MSLIKDYTYDIFISYAHVDNVPSSWENLGWIEKFYKDLDTLLTRRIGRPGLLKIWWDNRKLDGSVFFDDSIEEGIRKSAIMICLNSPSYAASEYCRKELELFYKKASEEVAGLKIGASSRVLNVMLYNIPFNEWLPQLSGTSGFPFHDSKNTDDFGDPVDTNTPEFKQQLQNLRDAIIGIMTDFSKVEKAAPVTQVLTGEDVSASDVFSIYMAEVSDSLRAVKKRTILELTKKGYEIITGVPPPDEEIAHTQKVNEELSKTNLAVHLLDQFPGREITGTSEVWYPQKQLELGFESDKSQLIWVPLETDLSTVEEESYREIMTNIESGKASSKKYEYIRGPKSSLVQEISDMAEQIKLERKTKVDTKRISVLLDTHFNDQIYALDLSRTLIQNQIQPFINPQEDDPRKNINILSDRISQVSKLVFFYGQVSREWVMERMSAALQLIITNDYSVEDFIVYLIPPIKNPSDIFLKQRFLKVSVIDGSRESQPDNVLIQQFLKQLKG